MGKKSDTDFPTGVKSFGQKKSRISGIERDYLVGDINVFIAFQENRCCGELDWFQERKGEGGDFRCIFVFDHLIH